jgi:ankyrin repeat protein
VVRLLLQHGANAQLQNEEGETPLQVALARGHRDVAQLLSAAPRA